MRTKRWEIAAGAVLGWLGLAWAWWLVARRGELPTFTMVVTPLALAVVTYAATRWWVRHNISIYREKGPRSAVPVAAWPYLIDRRGRVLRMDRAEVRAAREVVVSLGTDGDKHYRVVQP